MSDGPQSLGAVTDGEFWSALGDDGLAVAWGIDARKLSAGRRRTLTAETIALRMRDPESFARLQDEILARPARERVGALVARLL